MNDTLKRLVPAGVLTVVFHGVLFSMELKPHEVPQPPQKISVTLQQPPPPPPQQTLMKELPPPLPEVQAVEQQPMKPLPPPQQQIVKQLQAPPELQAMERKPMRPLPPPQQILERKIQPPSPEIQRVERKPMHPLPPPQQTVARRIEPPPPALQSVLPQALRPLPPPQQTLRKQIAPPNIMLPITPQALPVLPPEVVFVEEEIPWEPYYEPEPVYEVVETWQEIPPPRQVYQPPPPQQVYQQPPPRQVYQPPPPQQVYQQPPPRQVYQPPPPRQVYQQPPPSQPMYTDHRPMQQPQGLQNSNSRQQYLSMVQSKIDSHKQYPMAARRRNIQGKVGVRFVIRGDGGVHSIQITQSSGQSLLDDAAKRAVSSAAPFSRPPAQDFAGDIPLELTIVFTLN